MSSDTSADTAIGPFRPSWDADPLVPADLSVAVRFFRETLDPALDRDWSVPAGSLEMGCRDVLDHLASALAYYAGQIATGTPVRRVPIRDGEATHTAAELLEIVETAATIVQRVAEATPPESRAYHRMGSADVEGFVAMGCVEITVHAWDIANGLGVAFDPPAELLPKLLNRLFPWAPTGHDAWATFLYCVGRIPLGDLPHQHKAWGWHAAPREEWDGGPSAVWAMG